MFSPTVTHVALVGLFLGLLGSSSGLARELDHAPPPFTSILATASPPVTDLPAWLQPISETPEATLPWLSTRQCDACQQCIELDRLTCTFARKSKIPERPECDGVDPGGEFSETGARGSFRWNAVRSREGLRFEILNPTCFDARVSLSFFRGDDGKTDAGNITLTVPALQIREASMSFFVDRDPTLQDAVRTEVTVQFPQGVALPRRESVRITRIHQCTDPQHQCENVVATYIRCNHKGCTQENTDAKTGGGGHGPH